LLQPPLSPHLAYDFAHFAVLSFSFSFFFVFAPVPLMDRFTCWRRASLARQTCIGMA
jgi:hypothetical protein